MGLIVTLLSLVGDSAVLPARMATCAIGYLALRA